MEQRNVAIQKIIFLGAVRVGKSTIVKLLSRKCNLNNREYEMTQSVELYDKTLEFRGHTVNAIMVDTPGHELYKWIVKAVCDKDAFYALCFDPTNKKSLDILKAYLEEGSIQKGVIIGCKFDLQSRHAVSLSTAEEFAINNNLKLHFTSTMTAPTELEELFYKSITYQTRDTM